MESGDEMKKKWVKIYPQYIDKGAKHSEGRKLSNEVSIDNPTTREIFFVCSEVLRLDCREEKVLQFLYNLIYICN
jgi:signal recognition particle subunit SEC65